MVTASQFGKNDNELPQNLCQCCGLVITGGYGHSFFYYFRSDGVASVPRYLAVETATMEIRNTRFAVVDVFRFASVGVCLLDYSLICA